jgi:hypothetical protein
MLVLLDDYDVREITKSARLINGNNKIEAKDIKDFMVIGDNTYIKVEELLGWIENLNYELEKTQETLEDTINDVESNYKHISHWEQSGMSERDFI